MNKQELIGHVADRAGLNRNDAVRAVETMLEVIMSALKRGDEVRLVGFGNFSVTRRKPSTGRNPRTGEPIQIKASSQPKFRPGKALKDVLEIIPVSHVDEVLARALAEPMQPIEWTDADEHAAEPPVPPIPPETGTSVRH